LVKKLDLSKSQDFQSFLAKDQKSYANSFFINPVTSQEVKKCIDMLDINKATDIYYFNPKLVKMISANLSIPLADIINTSFSTGVFPEKLKYAKVTPIFKAGSALEVGNYRPVSILPLFDKIIEEILKNQLVEYLNSKGILCDAQFGFRKNKSTNMAIVDIISRIYTSLEKK